MASAATRLSAFYGSESTQKMPSGDSVRCHGTRDERAAAWVEAAGGANQASEDGEQSRQPQLFVSNSRTLGRGRNLCDLVGDR